MRNEIFVHLVDRRGKIGIFSHLSFEDLKRRTRVGLGAVGAVVVAPEIKSHRRRKIAGLLLMINALNVDMLSGRRRERHPDARELLFETRDVEAVGIETRKIASAEKLENFFSLIRERRTVFYDFIADAVNRRRLRGDWNAGIHKPAFRNLLAVRHELYGRKFDYAIFARRDAGGFDIKNDERTD